MQIESDAFSTFIQTGKACPGAVQSQMFGKPCFKLNGKAFMCFYENEMVFKLPEPLRGDALGWEGSRLFDPSGKNRPMKEWVQVPFKYAQKYKMLADQALSYLSSLT